MCIDYFNSLTLIDYVQGRSQDFRKGGANLLVYDYITRAKNLYPETRLYTTRESVCSEVSFKTGLAEANSRLIWLPYPRSALARGVWGHAPPENFWNFRHSEMVSDALFMRQKRLPMLNYNIYSADWRTLIATVTCAFRSKKFGEKTRSTAL